MASAEGARAVGIGWEPAPTPGWVAPHLEAEFPGLSLATVEVDGRPGRSPEPVRRRLRDLSDEFVAWRAGEAVVPALKLQVGRTDPGGEQLNSCETIRHTR